MSKEEIHKAAEEWIASTFGKHPEKTLDEILPGSVNQFTKDLTAFHLYQTKKMLEWWTDERIESKYYSNEYGHSLYRIGKAHGAKEFRDELLNQ